MEVEANELPEDDNLVVWEERFVIGIPIIDEEHKRLVNLCNELYKAVMAKEKSGLKDTVLSTLRTCVDYITIHFAHEEKLMQVCGYKDFDMHKKEHAAFTRMVLGRYQKVDKEVFYVSMGFVKFLYQWILSHVAHTDRLYVDDLKAYLKKNKI